MHKMSSFSFLSKAVSSTKRILMGFREREEKYINTLNISINNTNRMAKLCLITVKNRFTRVNSTFSWHICIYELKMAVTKLYLLSLM